MNNPRKRTELLLAAAALLTAAGVLLAAGVNSTRTFPQPTQTQADAAAQNPFEAGVSGTDAPVTGENQINGSYVVGYTGVVVYPPGEAPLQPHDSQTAASPNETRPAYTPPGEMQTQQNPPTQPPPQPVQHAYPVNLNTATQAQLESLPGIGPVKAQAILAWRAANGGFTNANQLLEVSGIGQKTLEGLLPYITW